MNSLLPIDCPLPPSVRCISTTRWGGHSAMPWHHFNLADHVGDDPQAVRQNRQLLRRMAQLPAEPLWLQQVHSARISQDAQQSCADARFSRRAGEVCAVLTADCLPILLCNQQGTAVAAIHAGWRGLAGGIIENTLRLFDPQDSLLAWLGPAISQAHFEVGQEVYQCFVQQDPQTTAAFIKQGDHYFADLYQIARLKLKKFGVKAIYGGNYCTYAQSDLFYSYRRDGQTGRMAHLIWIR